MSLSRLQVITPATDLALLTAAELRAAAGLADDDATHDTQLTSLGLEAAEWVAADILDIRGAGGRAPTVVAEAVRETFAPAWRGPELVLARRFISDVSVTENGIALVEDTDFAVSDDRGTLERLSNGYRIAWAVAPIVVDYTAGFANGSPSAVPAAIKAVASDYVALRYSTAGRDPMVRSETTEGLDSFTYRDAADSQGSFAEAARQRLSRYIAGTAG